MRCLAQGHLALPPDPEFTLVLVNPDLPAVLRHVLGRLSLVGWEVEQIQAKDGFPQMLCIHTDVVIQC